MTNTIINTHMKVTIPISQMLVLKLALEAYREIVDIDERDNLEHLIIEVTMAQARFDIKATGRRL